LTRIEGNDAIWFSRFGWTNSDTAAERVEIDICWTEVNGYTYAYFDSFPENRLYVTIGLRQKDNGAQMASMSVFRHKPNIQLENIQVLPGNGFLYYPGGEGDIYCMGNFSFNLGEYYRLIIFAHEDRIEGYISMGRSEGHKDRNFPNWSPLKNTSRKFEWCCARTGWDERCMQIQVMYIASKSSTCRHTWYSWWCYWRHGNLSKMPQC